MAVIYRHTAAADDCLNVSDRPKLLGALQPWPGTAPPVYTRPFPITFFPFDDCLLSIYYLATLILVFNCIGVAHTASERHRLFYV